MPQRPLRPCTHPGCGTLVLGASAQCVLHVRDYDRRRPSSTERGFDRRWRRLRLMILRRDPICLRCHVHKSEHVDHRIPTARGGSDQPSNLQGLCAGCHSRKTAQSDGGFGNAVRR